MKNITLESYFTGFLDSLKVKQLSIFPSLGLQNFTLKEAHCVNP
jgi:hypothetical protein